MRKRKCTSVLLILTLCFSLLFGQTAGAAVFSFETQNEYDSADIAWLTDLIIREDVSVSGAVSGVKLQAKPDYGYSATAASFRSEVAKACELFTVTERTPRISYIYLFELLNANSNLFSGQVDDEEVISYLEEQGIEMPSSQDTDGMVLARALYAAMVSGSFSAFSAEELGQGVAFQKALVKYLISLSGESEENLLKWAPEGSVASFDEYVLAASRLALWENGFDVSPDTPEDEVYKLVAVLSLRKMGIQIGTDASFDTVKAKYAAAMLGKRYDVTVSAEKLSAARAEGNEAFYLLKLLGEKKGVNVSDDMRYEEAFAAVAGNSDIFALEEGEFYADIYEYDCELSEKRDSIWIYPTAYLTGQDDAELNITVNGTFLPNNKFTEVQLNTAKSEQTLEIRVNAFIDGESSTCTYFINLIQGKAKSSSGSSTAIAGSDSIISGILASFGMNDPSVAGLMNDIYSTLPGSVKNVLSFISPTFGGAAQPSGQPASAEPTTSAVPAQPTSAVSEEDASRPATLQERLADSFFVSVLDRIGSVLDFVIYGVNGVGLSDKYQSRSVKHNFITFN